MDFAFLNPLEARRPVTSGQGLTNYFSNDLRVALATFVTVIAAMMPCAPAHADDPCVPPDPEITRSIEALQRFDHLIAKDGVFQVRKIGVGGETPAEWIRFDVTYLVRGQKVFQLQIAPVQTLDPGLEIRPLRMKDGAKLGLAWVMGAGGRLRCEYRVYDTGGHFSMKRSAW